MQLCPNCMWPQSDMGHLGRVAFTLPKVFFTVLLSLSGHMLEMHSLTHILEMRLNFFLVFFPLPKLWMCYRDDLKVELSLADCVVEKTDKNLSSTMYGRYFGLKKSGYWNARFGFFLFFQIWLNLKHLILWSQTGLVLQTEHFAGSPGGYERFLFLGGGSMFRFPLNDECKWQAYGWTIVMSFYHWKVGWR